MMLLKVIPERRDLLVEILGCIEEALPDEWTMRYCLVNSDWYQDSEVLVLHPGSHSQLTYQYGRLLGCAEWEGHFDNAGAVQSLLEAYGLWPDCCDNPDCCNKKGLS